MLIVLIYKILSTLLEIYSYVVVAYCLFSFIPQAFTNPMGYKIYTFVYKLVKPAFDLVYMIVPARFLTIGMVNIAPILIFLGLHLLQLGLFELVKIILIMLN